MAVHRLYPTAHLCAWSRGSGYGTHIVPGSWTDVQGEDCTPYCDDFAGGLDETDYCAVYSSPTAAQTNLGLCEWTLSDPPTNVTFGALRLVVWLRTSNGGPASIDSTPTVELFVNVGGTRYYAGAVETVASPVNRQTEYPTGTFVKFERSWASNPAGGAWARAALLAGAFKVGLASDGAGHGTGVDATTGSRQASLDVASVYAELDTTPTGLYVETPRTVLSHNLRLLREPVRMVEITVGPEFGDVQPGQTIWATHALLPGSPGTDAWRQVPLFVTSVKYGLAKPDVTIKALDLRRHYAAFWSPFSVVGVDPQYSGLALLDRGGGWSTSRAQVAYAQRPGDGLYCEVAADKPLLTSSGLLIQGGGDEAAILNNSFSQGAGNVFTNWTVDAGGGSSSATTSDYLFDVGGFRRAAVLAGVAGNPVGLVQTTAAITASYGLVHLVARRTGGSGAATLWVLRRSSDNWYWSDAAGAWAAAVQTNYIVPGTTPTHFWSKTITLGAPQTYTLTIITGGADTTVWYYANLYAGTAVRRSPLVTTNATLTRVADVTTITNDLSHRVWDISRGHFRVNLRPNWSHSDLADGEEKGVLYAGWFGPYVGGPFLMYHRTSAAAGYWDLVGAQVATAGATLPSRGTVYALAGRWTSVSLNELGLVGQAWDIWVDGTKGTTRTGAAEWSYNTSAVVRLGAFAVVDPSSSGYADGYLTNLLLDGRCPSDAEMARL
jgi:hypothetical protein